VLFFPLNVLGFDVHSINSVEFSNHTGYGKWKGHVLNSDELAELINGLEENDLDSFTHLLTGYVGSVSFLEQVYETIKKLKEKNPKMLYGIMNSKCTMLLRVFILNFFL